MLKFPPLSFHSLGSNKYIVSLRKTVTLIYYLLTCLLFKMNILAMFRNLKKLILYALRDHLYTFEKQTHLL